MKEFLARYPTNGPGPYEKKLATLCVCGHPFLSHHAPLGACMVVRGSGYCPCLDYDEEQQP